MNNHPEVWIVDDDKSIRWVLEKALQKAAVAIQSFAGPDEILRRINGPVTPDVIISDIRMPGMDGIRLLDELRQRAPRTPVIIMTAYSDLNRAVSAFQGGAFEYLSKPFDVDEVVSLVKRAITHRQNQPAPARIEEPPPASPIIGSAPAMRSSGPSAGCPVPI